MRAGCRRLLFLRIDAGPKGVHQIDDARRRRPPSWLDLFASLFLLEQVNQGVFVSILELRRIKVTGLGADDMSCKIEHLLREL